MRKYNNGYSKLHYLHIRGYVKIKIDWNFTENFQWNEKEKRDEKCFVDFDSMYFCEHVWSLLCSNKSTQVATLGANFTKVFYPLILLYDSCYAVQQKHNKFEFFSYFI